MADSTDRRTCLVCGATRPIDQFYASGYGNGRRNTCITCLQEADDRERRKRGAKVRHPRYNARGWVWCNQCEHYLPPESFKRHPSRPGTLWSYCKPCTRQIDRERYARRTSTLEGAERELAIHNRNKRKRTRRVDRQRREFIADSIMLLRRRGLTKMDISRLTDTSITSILSWERRERRVTKAVEDRFVVVIMETGHLPRQDRPAYRRRLPHPEMPLLLARCLPQIQSIPVRSRWHDRRAA